jgi:hypothetical protein
MKPWALEKPKTRLVDRFRVNALIYENHLMVFKQLAKISKTNYAREAMKELKMIFSAAKWNPTIVA